MGEETLTGGNTSGVVVRVGGTVRKPWLPTSARTVAYLETLRRRGVDVPHTYGRDDRGRMVIEFVPGRVAMDDAPLSPDLVGRVGALVRRIHDASASLPLDGPLGPLPPPHAADLLCHNDLATWNLVIDGERLVFIDWDGTAPSSRVWDLAYAAIAFAHLFPGARVGESATRLAALLNGYGADAALRRALPPILGARAHAMYDLLRRSSAEGHEPWAGMYVAGHGDHWRETTRFIAEHEGAWAAAAQTPSTR